MGLILCFQWFLLDLDPYHLIRIRIQPNFWYVSGSWEIIRIRRIRIRNTGLGGFKIAPNTDIYFCSFGPFFCSHLFSTILVALHVILSPYQFSFAMLFFQRKCTFIFLHLKLWNCAAKGLKGRVFTNAPPPFKAWQPPDGKNSADVNNYQLWDCFLSLILPSNVHH